MVWIHVVLAALTWLSLLWAAVAVGRGEQTQGLSQSAGKPEPHDLALRS